MIGYSVLNDVINNILATGLVRKVYHSVKTYQDGDNRENRYPVYPVTGTDEFEYVGVDDSKQMNCYLRQNGDLSVDSVEKLGGCNRMYRTKTLWRAIFFNDFENRRHDLLLSQLVKLSFTPHITLHRVITDIEQLLREESAIKGFNFGAKTFYCGIDFYLSLRLQNDNCETQFTCEGLENPVCLK